MGFWTYRTPSIGPMQDSRSHRGSSTARVTFVATWQDSALATWLRRGAAGARLDVASEIGRWGGSPGGERKTEQEWNGVDVGWGGCGPPQAEAVRQIREMA